MSAALGGSLAVAPPALASFWAPESGGSPNADAIHNLYVLIFIIAVIVFLGVVGTLLYSVWKFRASKGAVAAQIHGNTKLEISWTVGAAVIVVAIAVVTFIKLPAILNPPNTSANGILSASLEQPTPPNGKVVRVCITGRQFIWRYTYGSGCDTANDTFTQELPYSYEKMVVPANTTVQLVVQSTDVIHSWWVPALGGKVDAVPGSTTYTWFKAPHAGAYYEGQCAQLCGRQHAFMIATVHVVTPAQYIEYIATLKQQIKSANDQVSALRQQLIKQGDLTPSGTF